MLNKAIARWRAVNCALAGVVFATAVTAAGQTHLVEVLADKDSRYKIAGHSNPQVILKANEQVLLRISARKAQTQTRDGSVHGFTLVRAKDQSKVPGWDLTLKPGVHEFTLTVPSEPGEYWVICTVLCSEEHEEMRMKVVVVL